MCGIAGEFSNTYDLTKEKPIYLKMQSELRRRGPDQDGLYLKNNIALIHTRLSVIDIENGRQPMTFKQGDNEFTVVYNGELYNTQELRNELLNDGFDFIGHSDTEVLLKSYVNWGEECVKKFNGIFAFAIWESHNQRLFIARDRMGVKPFFYYESASGFIFASEIKALLAHKEIEPLIDMQSISELMLIGPGRTPGFGIFNNIKELEPAYCGYVTQDGLKASEYWELLDKDNYDTFEQTVEKVQFLVTDSIERQLISDVPIGTFLSGGLDSSIISAVSNNHLNKQGKQLHTFSVYYKDNEKYFAKSHFQPNSDEKYIDIMNDFLGTVNHKVILDTEDVVTALFDAVNARDLPGMVDIDSSLLLFCKEVKKFSTVALSGECADEIFGGYPWFRDKDIRIKEGFPWSQSTNYRKSFLVDEFAQKLDAQNYVYSRYKMTVEQANIIEGINKTEIRMKEMMKLNLDWFMQTLLDRKDRMSMYSGLEVRVPFCDYRIAEYLYTVPWEYKDYNDFEKGLLRDAVKDILPKDVLWRKKSPYPKTHNPLYLKAVSDLLIEIINDSSSPVLQIAKKGELEKLLNSKLSTPWYGQLMTVPQTIAYFVSLNYWLQKYKVRII